MRQCPVCDQKTDSPFCPTCGFDASRDYERVPTLAPTMSIAARRRAWQERQEAERQEQQWKIERDQIYKQLQTAESARDLAEKRANELAKELAQLKSEFPDVHIDSVTNNPKVYGTKKGYFFRMLRWFLAPIIGILHYLFNRIEYYETYSETHKSSSRLRNAWYFILYSLTYLLTYIICFGPICILVIFIISLFS